MSRRIDLPGSVRNMIGGLIGVLGWLLRFARLMLAPKPVLAAKLLATESQLAACVVPLAPKRAPLWPSTRGSEYEDPIRLDTTTRLVERLQIQVRN